MATDRISVRLNEETIKFLKQAGGDGRGAISRGVVAVIGYAQTFPMSFRAFLNGRADPTQPRTWGIGEKFVYQDDQVRDDLLRRIYAQTVGDHLKKTLLDTDMINTYLSAGLIREIAKEVHKCDAKD